MPSSAVAIVGSDNNGTSDANDANKKDAKWDFINAVSFFEEKLKNDSVMVISRNGKTIIAPASEIAKLPE